MPYPPSFPSRKRFIQLIFCLALIYLLICGVFYLAQSVLEYPREITQSDIPLAQAIQEASVKGLEPWNRTTKGARFPQGFVPTDFNQPHPRGTVVVFHGNGAWVIKHTAYVAAFDRRGFRAFLYEYPGYGGRPGIPREKTIVPDGRALIRSLAKEGYGPIYVWGESLGSGVAAAVCADPNLPVRGLALTTPWDSIVNVGYYRYPFLPVSWLTKDKYDSVANLEYFQHPVCVIRGSIDSVIPPKLTLDLYDHLSTPKKLILQAGYGHNNWPAEPNLTWWDDVLNFIAPKEGKMAANPSREDQAAVAKAPGA